MGIAESAEVDAGALDRQGRLGVVEEMPTAPHRGAAAIWVGNRADLNRAFESSDEGLNIEARFDPVFDFRW